MKPWTIIFNNSRGNRDKFFEILSQGKLQVLEMRNQIDNSSLKDIPIYVALIECSLETFGNLSEVLTGFSGVQFFWILSSAVELCCIGKDSKNGIFDATVIGSNPIVSTNSQFLSLNVQHILEMREE